MPSISSISMFVAAGQTYIIEIPVDIDLGLGFFPREAPMTIGGKLVEFKNGFYVEDEEVGEITHVYTDRVAIDYKHKIPGDNNIWFYAKTGEIVRYYVAHMQVHDHGSIVTGGPAYGTYYSPVQEETE